MASRFSEAFAETNWPALLEDYGEDALYSPKSASVGAPPIPVKAIITRDNIGASYEPDGRGEVLMADFDVGTDVIPNPQRGDKATFDDIEWAASERDPSDGSGYTHLRMKHVAQEIISLNIDPIVKG